MRVEALSSTAAGSPRWLRLSHGVADALETVFGPDPGRLRLRQAFRVLISALISLGIVLLLFGSRGMQAAPEVALGFMLSMFANMAVRDPSARGQAITLVLLIAPALGAVTLASLLAPWPWASDIVFLLIVSAAPLAQAGGPRLMALAMVGFITYFLGEFLHPQLSALPDIAAAGAVAIASAAFTRFLLVRDRPGQALRKVRQHIARRLGLLLDEVDAVLAAPAGRADTLDERLEHRIHKEIARLNDAFSIAQDQLEGREGRSGEALSWDRFFALELAAERLVRVATAKRGGPDAAAARQRLRELRAGLAHGRVPPAADHGAQGLLAAALDRLQQALADAFQPRQATS